MKFSKSIDDLKIKRNVYKKLFCIQVFIRSDTSEDNHLVGFLCLHTKLVLNAAHTPNVILN